MWPFEAPSYSTSLSRENAELRKQLANEKACHEAWEQEHLKEMGELNKQLAECQKDAARYRWLKQNCDSGLDLNNNNPQLIYLDAKFSSSSWETESEVYSAGYLAGQASASEWLKELSSAYDLSLRRQIEQCAELTRECDELLQQRADILNNQSALVGEIHKSYSLKLHCPSCGEAYADNPPPLVSAWRSDLDAIKAQAGEPAWTDENVIAWCVARVATMTYATELKNLGVKGNERNDQTHGKD